MNEPEKLPLLIETTSVAEVILYSTVLNVAVAVEPVIFTVMLPEAVPEFGFNEVYVLPEIVHCRFVDGLKEYVPLPSLPPVNDSAFWLLFDSFLRNCSELPAE